MSAPEKPNVQRPGGRAGYAFDGQAAEKAAKAESDIREIERRVWASKSQFVRSFSKHMSGEEITRMEVLQGAFEVQSRSGAAISQYDGVPAPDSYGPRTPSDTGMRASALISAAESVIVSLVQPYHSGAWTLMHDALCGDYDCVRAGHHYTLNIKRDRLTPDGSRKRVIRLVQRCAIALGEIDRKSF